MDITLPLRPGQKTNPLTHYALPGAGDDPQGDGPEAVASRAVVCQGTRLRLFARAMANE